jgi:hypothetical protein
MSLVDRAVRSGRLHDALTARRPCARTGGGRVAANSSHRRWPATTSTTCRDALLAFVAAVWEAVEVG